MGSSIGGLLADSGVEVYLIDPWREHVDAMNRDGLRLSVDASQRNVEVEARTGCEGIGTVDLVIVLVKSFNTRTAVMSARSLIGDNTIVLSLQNGLGNEEIIEEVVGRHHVVGGRTFAGGAVLGPGSVKTNVLGKTTFIGELDGSDTARVKEIARAFTAAGLETMISHNVIGIMWDKLLVNVATAALSGITRLPYGGLYSVPELKEVALEAIGEGMAVAAAAGVILDTKSPLDAWVKASEGLPPDFKPSLSQGLERGQMSEIDFLNGAVVSYGARFGIPTPVNRTLVAAIRGIEYKIEHYPDGS